MNPCPALPRWLPAAALLLTLAGGGACQQRDNPQPQPVPQPKETTTVAPQDQQPAAPAAKKVFASGIAGSWYPDNAKALQAELAGCLQRAEAKALPNIHALLLPHAGYRYSGPTAAWGVKQVQGQTFARVIVLGPSHRLHLPNRIAIPDATHYQTPLGEVALDTDAIAALRREDFCQSVSLAQQGQEHSVQIEVPLLQATLAGPFKLVPIVVGELDAATARRIAGVLAKLVDAQTLLVVSSDFTHYGADFNYVPFETDVAAGLEKLDLGAFKQIEAKDLDGFNKYLEQTGATICGHYPIAILLALLPPDAKVHRLRYDTSGALTGDFAHSVSYLSAAFTWQPAAAPAKANAAADAYTAAEKAALLKLARATIVHFLKTGKQPTAAELGIELTPAMQAKRGAFVTLTEAGDLRGCIGTIMPTDPLADTVSDNAINAAVNDPRFPAVTAADVPQLHLEISVLTVPQPVAAWQDIQLGRHGMILTKGGRRALFLPQVAPEQGWDLETTLNHLARKAGLDGNAWRSGATFEVFEAIVFGEVKKE